MFFYFAGRRCGFKTRVSQSLVLFFIVFFTLQFSTNAQTMMTRRQFSRLNVLARASVFERDILKAAETEGVDPNVLWTIAYNETRFRPWLQSPKNARGLMQFIPSTAARFDLADPYEPIPAIRAAAKYVKYLSGLFGGRIDSILAAYNSGEGTVSAYVTGHALRDGRKIINAGGQKTIGGVPPYSETIRYVGRGLKIYRWLVARQTFASASYKATFPKVISASVARVSLDNPELGSVPNFIAPTVIQENSSQIAVAQDQPTNAPNEQATKKSQEIFYDPRSGNRYILGENGKVKLPAGGAVIVSVDTRRPAYSARSLFFAAPVKK